VAGCIYADGCSRTIPPEAVALILDEEDLDGRASGSVSMMSRGGVGARGSTFILKPTTPTASIEGTMPSPRDGSPKGQLET